MTATNDDILAALNRINNTLKVIYGIKDDDAKISATVEQLQIIEVKP